MDFSGCTLYVSARSPFARRVRLALIENAIPHEEKILDVFKPQPELSARNPLARVPTVVLTSGHVLVDSNLILQALYESLRSPLLPTDEGERLECYYWMAQATGVADKCIEYFYEMSRPAETRDEAWIAETRRTTQAVFELLEKRLQGREFLVGGRLTQADLDVGTVLRYFTLRVSADWQEKFPNLVGYLRRLETRPSFARTTPPPPA